MSFPTRHFRPFALLFAALWIASTGAPGAFAQNNSSGLSPLGPSAESAKAKATPPRNGLNKADLEFYIRHLFVWGPQIQVEIGDFEPSPIEGLMQTKVKASYQLASEERTFYVSKDGAHVFEGSIFEVAKNPFHETIEKLTTTNQPSFGTAGAPVVIVVFSDFECPYCAQEAKTLRSEVLKTYPEQVRVFFHDFPLSTHNWAKPAAIAGRCIFEQEPLSLLGLPRLDLCQPEQHHARESERQGDGIRGLQRRRYAQARRLHRARRNRGDDRQVDSRGAGTSASPPRPPCSSTAASSAARTSGSS